MQFVVVLKRERDLCGARWLEKWERKREEQFQALAVLSFNIGRAIYILFRAFE